MLCMCACMFSCLCACLCDDDLEIYNKHTLNHTTDEQFCNAVTVSYTGFTITWNMTSVGITAEAPCSGFGIEGKVYKLCMFY